MTISIQTLCAGAKVPDPACKHRNGEPHESCICDCEGCQVFVLPDVVRPICWCLEGSFSYCGECSPDANAAHGEWCEVCHGLGWAVATDGWVWWEVLDAAGGWGRLAVQHLGYHTRFHVEVRLPEGLDISSGWNNNPEAAFFQALYKALEAMGATFVEERTDAAKID